MDKIQQIALSKVADVLSKGELVTPQKELWMKIYNNSGYSDLYKNYKFKLIEKSRNENWETYYFNNESSYSAILESLLVIIEENETIIKFLNEYLQNVNIHKIFVSDIETFAQKRNNGYFDFESYVKKNGLEKARELLIDYPSFEMKKLRSNLNLLYLDLHFDKFNKLQITTLSSSISTEYNVRSGMLQWLDNNYNNISEAYENACKMASDGQPAECLTNCRSVITGIFSYKKDEGKKWISGLQNVCYRDKNISNVDKPNNIPSWKNNCPNDPEVNKRYNYPRFKTIAQTYSYLSDLGPHITEANRDGNMVDCEMVDIHDAMMGLRFTESILIWLYQTSSM